MAEPTDPPVRARMPDKTVFTLEYSEARTAWVGTLAVPGDPLLFTTGPLGKALGDLLEQYKKRGAGRG